MERLVELTRGYELVNAAGEKAIEPLVVWSSKKPRCFKTLRVYRDPWHLLLLQSESMDDYRNYDISSGQN